MEKGKVKQKSKKSFWRPEEDLILKKYVEIHGEGKWQTVSEKTGLMRGGRSCRLRWKNYLRPNIKRGEMSEEEKDLIIRLHKLLGNRWSLIAGRLPGRTDNEVKNYWNTHLNRNISRDQRVQEMATEAQSPALAFVSNSKSETPSKAEGERKEEETRNNTSSRTEGTGNHNCLVDWPFPTEYASLFTYDEPFLPILDNIIFQAFVNCSGEALQ